jgi:hypothetical protein
MRRPRAISWSGSAAPRLWEEGRSLPALPPKAQNSDVARRGEREHHRPHRANRTPLLGFARERSLHTGAAVRYRELRRILQQIVIAGLPATAAGCVEAVIDNDCVDTVDRTFHVATPAQEAALQFSIDRCRVDVSACPDLCQKAMAANNIPQTASRCSVEFFEAGVDVHVSYEVFDDDSGCPIEGRRPAGLVEPRHMPARSAVGAWLARAAWLEAASIHAFVQLARELGEHGAPPALVRWALLAADEEVRHARAVSRLAARHGAFPPVPEVAPPRPRSLEALAIENAAEGCVREAWGAVIAEWQARAALDPEIRTTFAAIARDEARHAALALAIDQWARQKLDPAAIARVDAAREAAIRELASADDLASPALGLPDGPQVRGLYARTLESLWNGGRTCHA